MGRNLIEQQHKLFDSPIVTVATTTVISNIQDDLETHYIGARYYQDAAGTLITPGAGTVQIQGLDEATNQWTDTAGTLTCTDVTDKQTVAGNVTSFRGVPTGINTATHWQLFSSSNL